MLKKLTWPTVAWPTLAWPTLAVIFGISLTACKILPTPSAEDGGNAPAFNADKMVEDIWAAKVVPYVRQKAGSFPEVHALAKADPAAAGAKFGNPKKQANSPWTFAVRLEGKIVAANTQSRAATMDVDADGDGKADARVQIGPAMRGTALRDSLDFIQFNDFTNQIDSPSSARRSTSMPTRRCSPSCRAKRWRAAASGLSALMSWAAARTCRW